MFENIIGHENIVERIKSELKGNKFPRSSIITGAVYSGKQTIALEIARSITCQENGNWGCMCESCRLQRTLMHPATLLTGFDRFLPEINMAREIMIKKKGEMFSRFLFIRAVRKLIKRFDPVFTDENDPKIKKIIPLIRDLEDIIQIFNPVDEIKDEILIKKSLEITEKCGKILKDINISGVTVNQIRKITYWVHTTGYKDKKVIIIENCEKMNESARNAVLKVLEEPPVGVYFIFLTSRYGELIPTIRSRLRRYDLKERNLYESREVIEKIFRDTPGIEFSLKDYFNSWSKDNDIIQKSAKDFIIDIFDTERDNYTISSDLRKIIKTANTDSFQGFLEAVIQNVRLLIKNNDFMKSSPDTAQKINKFSEIINAGYRNKQILNMNPELIIENIFFRMRNNI